MDKMYRIGQAAKVLGVSIQTLRRWAKIGSLEPDYVSPGGHRYYSEQALESFLRSLVHLARTWVASDDPKPPVKDLYCETSSVFLARLNRLDQELQRHDELRQLADRK